MYRSKRLYVKAVADDFVSSMLFRSIPSVIKAGLMTALQVVLAGPCILDLHIFSTSRPEIDLILDSTEPGGVTTNDGALHAEVPGAPFSGVGDSGSGSHHGKWGFDRFCHSRTTVAVPRWFDWFVAWRYRPFHMSNSSEIHPGRAKFRKGETLEEQSDGSAFSSLKLPFI